MGLIKCPDCQKQISDRADKCPHCGCPKQFFEIDNIKENQKKQNIEVCKHSTNEKQELTKADTSKLKNIPKSDSKKVHYIFCKRNIAYYEDARPFAQYIGKMGLLIEKTIAENNQTFKSSLNYSEKLMKIIDNTVSVIDDSIMKSIQFLCNYDLYYSKEFFIDKGKAFSSYQEIIMPILVDVSEILSEEKEREFQRDIDKLGRTKWSGGGFGITGAIKGKITADMLNLGSGMLHSIGDASRKIHDDVVIKQKMNNIFLKNRSRLCEGIRVSVTSVMFCVFALLDTHREPQNVININAREAQDLWVKQKNKSSDKKVSYLAECIRLFPAEKVYVEDIIKYLDEKELFNLHELLKFWGLESWLSIDRIQQTIDNKNRQEIKNRDSNTSVQMKNESIHNTNSSKLDIKTNIKIKKLLSQKELEEYIVKNYSSDTKQEAIAFYKENSGKGITEAKEEVYRLLKIVEPYVKVSNDINTMICDFEKATAGDIQAMKNIVSLTKLGIPLPVYYILVSIKLEYSQKPMNEEIEKIEKIFLKKIKIPFWGNEVNIKDVEYFIETYLLLKNASVSNSNYRFVIERVHPFDEIPEFTFVMDSFFRNNRFFLERQGVAVLTTDNKHTVNLVKGFKYRIVLFPQEERIWSFLNTFCGYSIIEAKKLLKKEKNVIYEGSDIQIVVNICAACKKFEYQYELQTIYESKEWKISYFNGLKDTYTILDSVNKYNVMCSGYAFNGEFGVGDYVKVYNENKELIKEHIQISYLEDDSDRPVTLTKENDVLYMKLNGIDDSLLKQDYILIKE